MSLVLVATLGVVGAPSDVPNDPPSAEEALLADSASERPPDEAFWRATRAGDGAGFYARYHLGAHFYTGTLGEMFADAGFGMGLQLGASWDRWIVTGELGFSTLGSGDPERGDPESALSIRHNVGACGAHRVLLAPVWALTAGLCYQYAWMPGVDGHGVDFDVALVYGPGGQRDETTRLRMDMLAALRVSPLWLVHGERALDGVMLAAWLGMSFDIASFGAPGGAPAAGSRW